MPAQHLADVSFWITGWVAIGALLGPRLVRLLDPAFFLCNALCAWVLERRRNDSSAPKGFWAFALPLQSVASRSAVADYAFTFAPAILGHLISLPALIGAFAIAKAFEPALDALLGPALPHSAFSLVGELVYLAGWIVIYDFGIFFAHWGMHKSSLLWEFHKVHHSAEVLNPLTVFRQHPVDAIVLDFVPNFFVALFLVVFARWHQPGLYGYVVIGVSADCWLRLVGFQHLRHTHMPFYYPASLNRFLISPSAHQLHHSSEERHFDRNFGNILAIWDHLFGTYIAPSREDRYRLGLAGGEEREYRHAVHLLLLLPIVKAARVCLSGVGKPLEGLKRLFAA